MCQKGTQVNYQDFESQYEMPEEDSSDSVKVTENAKQSFCTIRTISNYSNSFIFVFDFVMLSNVGSMFLLVPSFVVLYHSSPHS